MVSYGAIDMTAIIIIIIDWLIDDRLHSAILRSLEHTQGTRMWFYISD